MTEREWLTEAARAQLMVHVLAERKLQRTNAGKRKLRLFACGCCRVAWSRLPDGRLGEAVEVAERSADGLATKDEMATARERVEWMTADGALPADTPDSARVAVDMAVASTHAMAFEAAFYMTATVAPLAGQSDGERTLCGLVRCVFGNPFRPVIIRSAWLTPTVIDLARAAYDERIMPSGELDPDRLAVLSDALEEAGCDNKDILDHLRSSSPHVRGCWAVDNILGRE